MADIEGDRLGIGTSAAGSTGDAYINRYLFVGGDMEVNGHIFMYNNEWIGIAVDEPRLVFDETNGEINILDAKVGINTSAPGKQFEVKSNAGGGAGGGIRLTDSNGDARIHLYTASSADGNGVLAIANSSDVTKIYLHSGDASYITGGNLGIGTTSPSAQLHIDQSSSSGAKPVLLLDQADTNEPYIEFVGFVETNEYLTDANQAITVVVNGDTRYIKLYE